VHKQTVEAILRQYLACSYSITIFTDKLLAIGKACFAKTVFTKVSYQLELCSITLTK